MEQLKLLQHTKIDANALRSAEIRCKQEDVKYATEALGWMCKKSYL